MYDKLKRISELNQEKDIFAILTFDWVLSFVLL